jgi:hypothetical protein
MLPAELVNYQHGMSRERFKQEAALVILRSLMLSVGHQVREHFSETKPKDLAKALGQWEDVRAKVIGGVVEAIADAVTYAMGPDAVPRSGR